MRVKNINGTSNNICKCSSWLEHYEKYAKSKKDFCCVIGCLRKAEVGAHVRKVNSNDQNWYIVPFCKQHNQSKEELTLYYFEKLALAAVNKTCGR